MLLLNMKLLSVALLLLLSGSKLSAENRCQEFAINDCKKDGATIIFEINTSEDICQAYCTITPGCTFYRYDSKPTQGISCALYSEPFYVYAQHCNEITGPKGFSLLEECSRPAENSCDIIQEGNCAFYGKEEESDTFEDVDNCVAMCEFVTCDYWVYQREASACLLQSNLVDGKNRKCNVVYGPPQSEKCDEAPEPTTYTPDPEFPTTPGPSPSPGLCDQFPNDGLHTVAEESNCGCYWECFNGQATYRCCEHCFLFEPSTSSSPGQCTNEQDPNFSGCGGRWKDPDCDPEPGPPPCIYPDGYFKDNRTCDHYFICHYDTPKSIQCQTGDDDWHGTQQLYYNFKDVMCDWHERVECDIRPICHTVEGEDPKNLDYKHCQCQGAEMVPAEDFKCPAGELGIFGDPFNCQKFYFCADGTIQETGYCDPNTYWDKYAADCIADGKCRGRPVCQDIKHSDLCFCTHE